MNLRHVSTRLTALCALALCAVAPASAKVTTVAYFLNYESGATAATLVAWDDALMRATETDPAGVRRGSYSVSGSQRTITYDTPQSANLNVYDADCLAYVDLQRSVMQVIETRLSGTPKKGMTNWTLVGSDTHLTGCKAGQTFPFSMDALILPRSHLAMNALPAQRPLAPGDRWGGLVEAVRDMVTYPDSTFHMPQDTAVVTSSGTKMNMATSGNKLPVTLGADGWLSMTLPGGTERVFTRVARDKPSGAETWLMGDRVGGALQWVNAIRMVVPQAGASFASTNASARVWRKEDPSFSREYRLYAGFTGLMVDDVILPTPGHFESPLTWTYDPQALHTIRLTPPWTRDRLWVPLARKGIVQWVMESEIWTNPTTGEVRRLIEPRVSSYRDMGPAAP